MKRLFKYSQQIIIGLVIIIAVGGVVLAAPSFGITSIVSGFIHHPTHPIPGHAPGTAPNFYYGYGWSGNLQEWGYGYGYVTEDCAAYYETEEECAISRADYGFEGTEGPVTVDSISVEKTTATINYSTSYLSIISGAASLNYPVIAAEVVSTSGDQSFSSGQRTWNITDLTCDTTYYYEVIPQDAGGNYWPVAGSFTTDSCDSNGHERERVVGVMGKSNTSNSSGANHNPRGLVLPPITLSPGSFGNDVKNLQILLNFFGTFLASDGAGAPYQETETFGQKTFNALKKFQSTFGLNKVDGIYGQETRGMMEEFLQ